MVRLNAVVAGSRPHSVRFYLVLLALAVAIPLAGLSFYVSARVAATEREATEAALLNSAGSLAAAVDQEIDKHIAVATTLAHSKSLLDGDWPDGNAPKRRSTSCRIPGWSCSIPPDRSC